MPPWPHRRMPRGCARHGRKHPTAAVLHRRRRVTPSSRRGWRPAAPESTAARGGALSRADIAIRGDEPAARRPAATMLAARYAAMATMVADLVGQHHLTVDHIEMVRWPWVAAFGEID